MNGDQRDDPFALLADACESHLTTLRGHVRRTLVETRLSAALPPPPLRILDIGGGAAHEAIGWAGHGYRVVIVDPSEEMLRRASDRLRELDRTVRDRVEVVRAPTERLQARLGGERFPVITCHGVLMYRDEPGRLLGTLVVVAEPGGLISILAKNAASLSMRPALEGRWAEARALLDHDVSPGGLGRPTRGDTIDALSSMLDRHGASVLAWFGVRIFTDHLGDVAVDEASIDEIVALELAAGAQDPYRQVARL